MNGISGGERSERLSKSEDTVMRGKCLCSDGGALKPHHEVGTGMMRPVLCHGLLGILSVARLGVEAL